MNINDEYLKTAKGAAYVRSKYLKYCGKMIECQNGECGLENAKLYEQKKAMYAKMLTQYGGGDFVNDMVKYSKPVEYKENVQYVPHKKNLSEAENASKYGKQKLDENKIKFDNEINSIIDVLFLNLEFQHHVSTKIKNVKIETDPNGNNIAKAKVFFSKKDIQVDEQNSSNDILSLKDGDKIIKVYMDDYDYVANYAFKKNILVSYFMANYFSGELYNNEYPNTVGHFLLKASNNDANIDNYDKIVYKLLKTLLEKECIAININDFLDKNDYHNKDDIIEEVKNNSDGFVKKKYCDKMVYSYYVFSDVVSRKIGTIVDKIIDNVANENNPDYGYVGYYKYKICEHVKNEFNKKFNIGDNKKMNIEFTNVITYDEKYYTQLENVMSGQVVSK